MTIFSTSVHQTQKIGAIFAKEVLHSPLRRHAFVGALQGELGSGKTSFVQGFARGLGVKEKILSPTFVIFKNYALSPGDYVSFCHIDCYRLEGAKELIDLGWKEMVADPTKIILIEWPERIQSIIPTDPLWFTFTTTGRNAREISVVSYTYGRKKGATPSS